MSFVERRMFGPFFCSDAHENYGELRFAASQSRVEGAYAR
jgi:hypothetical protein